MGKEYLLDMKQSQTKSEYQSFGMSLIALNGMNSTLEKVGKAKGDHHVLHSGKYLSGIQNVKK